MKLMTAFKSKRKGTKIKLFGFDGQQCVGRAIITLCVFDNHTAVVTDLFVREEFRGNGYGTQFVQEAVRYALTFSNITRVLMQDGSDHGETTRIARNLNFSVISFPKMFCKYRP